MSHKTRSLRLFQSTALASILFFVADAAWADSNNILGLSSDGSVMLSPAVDASTSEGTYALVNTITGATTTLPIQDPTGFIDAQALSADGKTVVGDVFSSSEEHPFLWTASGGYVDLGSLGGTSGYAIAVSADGTAVAGASDVSMSQQEAFYWSSATGIIGLGSLQNGQNSRAIAISADGTTVVGEGIIVSNSTAEQHAFVWNTTTQVMQNIDADHQSSYASAVSSNGSVVAGSSTDGDSYGVFRWTAETGMVDIGSLGTADTSLAAMDSDGGVLVGQSATDAGDYHAYRYVASTETMTDLGTIGGGSYSSASAVNADGSVVVGSAFDSANVSHGFRWTEATGMQTVEQWLSAQGINLGNETTRTAKFVSADGTVVVGETSNNTTYIARNTGTNTGGSGENGGSGDSGETGGGGTGIIDTAKFLPTVVSANTVAVQNAVYSADTIMFGAQGEPMRNLLSSGRKSVWGTVDAGHDDGHGADGGLGLGEFGFGYGIADGVTARFAAGGTYTKQDLDAGGDVRQRGFYLSPEVSADIGHNLYLTVGGYWGRGSIDSHRGYQNGIDRDYSDGSTNSQTWGAKIRFDWLNAATIENTAITPYTALSFAHTKVDGFTEDNGSFPVSYDATDDHATIARIGADFVHPLTDKVRLLAKTEADYQFEDHAAGTSGTILGVSDFNLDGQDLKHFWLRGGLGAEFDVGKASTASVMVNATTQGQDPNFWVRTNFTVKF